jgi:hypothetical protein
MKKPDKIIFAILTFIVSFTVYIFTAAPEVTFTDSGELAAVCVTLGIPHPTGYPLFVILGHAWSLLPLPISEIYSLNIFAGFLTSLSAVFFLFNVYRIIYNVEKQNDKQLSNRSLVIIAFVSSLIYSFATTIWAQGVALEVYSLQLLIFNLIIHELLCASTKVKKREKHYFMAALLIGLGFSNHMTTLLTLPAVFFLFFRNPSNGREFISNKFALLSLLTIPFIIGLSLYLYLPLHSATIPEFNWGWVSRGWDKFLYHVQGKQYQIWMFSDSEAIGKNFNKFIALFPYQIGWIGIVPFLLGIYELFKRSKKLLVFLLLLIIICLAYSLNYSIHDIEAYFSLAIIAIVLLTAVGIYAIAKINLKYAAIFFTIPVISLIINYSENNRSDEYLVPEYTRIMIENLEENAIIVSSQWDYWCSAFWYYQRVEDYRRDVVLIEHELLRRTWFPDQLSRWYPETILPCQNSIDQYMEELEKFESGKKYSNMIQSYFVNMINCFIDTHFGERPIYVTLDVIQKEPDIARNYLKIPVGFAFRLEKEQKPYTVSVDNIQTDKFISSLEGKQSHLVEGIRELFSLNISIIGNYALNTNQLDVAREAFEMALKVNPENITARDGLNKLSQIRSGY